MCINEYRYCLIPVEGNNSNVEFSLKPLITMNPKPINGFRWNWIGFMCRWIVISRAIIQLKGFMIFMSTSSGYFCELCARLWESCSFHWDKFYVPICLDGMICGIPVSVCLSICHSHNYNMSPIFMKLWWIVFFYWYELPLNLYKFLLFHFCILGL